jgi:hypothetical protein
MRIPAILLACALLAGCAGPGPGQPPADRSYLVAALLDGAHALPPNKSAGTGRLLATLGPNGILNWELRHSGLSGPPTDIRLYEGEVPVVDLTAVPPSGSARGSVRLDPARRQSLLGGHWTAEIRTAAYPNGEIAGPIAQAQ